MFLTFRAALLSCLLYVCLTTKAYATFSIVACDENSGWCGVAVATHNLAVGDGVPFAQAGIGAGVSQFETNPIHKLIILEALEGGANAQDALAQALEKDNQFSDGNDINFRQIGVVSVEGAAAAYSGHQAGAFFGHRAKGFVSVQGNGLVSEKVLGAMWDCFHKTDGSLGERLMTALEAGQAKGGQKIGLTSAALLVSTEEGWPVDVNLRVDYSTENAIAELRRAFNANVARQRLFQARRLLKSDNKQRRDKLVIEALKLAPDWDRIWLNASMLAADVGDMKEATKRFCRFSELNPVWADMLRDEIDFTGCE